MSVGGVEISRLGSFTTQWGESVVWDERRRRLVFADCLGARIHWIDDLDAPEGLGSFEPPSMPTGIVATDDGRLVVVLDDGLHVVDLDAGTTSLLSTFPAEMGGRGNDLCADLDGNLVTGTLNLGPAPGSSWRRSWADGSWQLLDDDVANTNGPAVVVIDGRMTLIIGDTGAVYHAYDYDPATGATGPRRTFGDTRDLDGAPDGSAVDVDGGLWCALVGGGQIVRFVDGRLDRAVAVPVPNPTDVAFGGDGLDRLFVTSIAGSGDLDGALLVIDGLGVQGRVEPRATLLPD